MLSFGALITKKKFWSLYSVIIRIILKLYGIKVGKKFYVEGTPRLKINGKAENIVIGNNVSFLGEVDLRNRENGRIIFGDNVTVEGPSRIVSAREGTIEVGEGSIICVYAIINGGEDIKIGRKCIIGPRASINANEHRFTRNVPVREAGFVHAPIHIEDDCWLATNVVINKGVRLGKGSIIGSNAVITEDTDPYSINVGVPARKIGERQ